MKEILYFSAPWCGPCRNFKPIMESVSNSIPVRFINVDENPQLAAQYVVRSVPMLVFLKNGQEADKTIGVLTESQVKEKWNLL
jgi:thioredoxin-like negative regulator of GroEL